MNMKRGWAIVCWVIVLGLLGDAWVRFQETGDVFGRGTLIAGLVHLLAGLILWVQGRATVAGKHRSG